MFSLESFEKTELIDYIFLMSRNENNRIVYKWLRPSTNVTLLNLCGGFS